MLGGTPTVNGSVPILCNPFTVTFKYTNPFCIVAGTAAVISVSLQFVVGHVVQVPVRGDITERQLLADEGPKPVP
jgi:hypothetical protein